jgi:hypothetical protein
MVELRYCFKLVIFGREKLIEGNLTLSLLLDYEFLFLTISH